VLACACQAVGEWCRELQGAPKGLPAFVFAPCSSNATVDTLTAAGWFDAIRHHTRRSVTKYYFQDANLQSLMLGNIFLEQHFVICTLPMLPELLRGLATWMNASVGPLGTFNQQRWPGLPGFRKRVPWRDVRRFFANDLALYRMAEEAGGCIAHTMEGKLRDSLTRALSGRVQWQ